MQMDLAAIFRLQLFKISEGFIASQAECLTKFKPLYVGRRQFGPAPEGAETALPPKHGTMSHASIVLARNARPFLAAIGPRPVRLIHAHFAVDAVYALPLAEALSVPLITTIHGFDIATADRVFLKSGRPALINSVLFRGALQRRGALFICISQHIRQLALAKGFPPERTVLHYMGIDVERHQPASLEAPPNQIVHIARLVEKKGTAYLLRAVSRLLPRHPDLTLKIVGDGPLRGELEAEAQSLGLGEHVRFTGALKSDAAMKVVEESAMVVVPSVTAAGGDVEGLPIVVLEASARGLPVIASRSGGIEEAIVEGETGYLLPERDVDALAERMGRLLADPIAARGMGERARAHMVTNFDIRSQTRRLEDLYIQASNQEVGGI